MAVMRLAEPRAAASCDASPAIAAVIHAVGPRATPTLPPAASISVADDYLSWSYITPVASTGSMTLSQAYDGW
jgi:hypothetical protein